MFQVKQFRFLLQTNSQNIWLKNLIKKKYRELSNDVVLCDISDFCNSEETLINVSDIAEDSEKNKIILNTLNGLKDEEKQVFIMLP